MKLASIKNYLTNKFTILIHLVDGLQWKIDLLDEMKANIKVALDELDDVNSTDELSTWWLTLNKCVYIDMATLTDNEIIELYSKIENKLDDYFLENW